MGDKSKREIKKIVPNEISSEQKTSIRTRVLVAIPLVAIFLVACVFGGYVMMAFVALLAGFAFYEIIKSSNKKLSVWIWILTYFFGYLMVFWPLVDINVQNAISSKANGSEFVFLLEKSFIQLNVPITLIGSVIILYFLTAILDENFDWKDVAYLFAFVFFVSLGLQSMLICRFYPFEAFSSILSNEMMGSFGFKWLWSAGLLFIVFAIVSLTDVFAYFGGMLFGKHKMNPRVSPKKTWEGFFIGWAMGSFFFIGLMFLLSGLGYPILPELDITHWWRILILGILMPLIGTLGDLAFSLIKRGQGIKDYSKLLPGHGGILDRFDSPILACLGTAIIISFFVQGWIL